MFSFRYNCGASKHTKTLLLYRMGKKIKLQTLVHIFTILQIYTSQRSVATQLRWVVYI